MRVIIIGAGMAGASLAFHLSTRCEIWLLEAEEQPGYHTSGRSAALYAKSYGNDVIRQLTVASEDFYEHPPANFAENALLTPRGAMFIGRCDQRHVLSQLHSEIAATVPSAELISAKQARRLVPILDPAYVDQALIEYDSRDMDVHAILQGYLRGARAQGANLVYSARADTIRKDGGSWRVTTAIGTFQGDVVVNAAGAWADHVASLVHLPPAQVTPKRRTAFLVRPPSGQDTRSWPAMVDVEETFYVKPDAGMLLCSPADETPSEPCDAYPEDIDIAFAVERIQHVMDLPVTTIGRSWAGLRSFAPDKTPVVGMDPAAQGFFWLAGQGGYGIQTAPAMAQLAAHLISGQPLDIDVDRHGVAEAMRPGRFR